MKRFITLTTGIVFSFFGWFFPLFAQAADDEGLLPDCASGTGVGNCNTCHFLELFANVSEIILQFVGVAVLVTVLIGGLMWILSAGNQNMVQKGQAILVGSVIGALITLGAYFIINGVIAGFVGDSDFEDVQLFGTDWDTYCTESNPGAIKSSCEGQADGEACTSGSCTDNCECLNEVCVTQCEVTNQDSQVSCVLDESACTNGINGGDSLCPSSAPYCCVTESTTTATDETVFDCTGVSNRTDCSTDDCSDDCQCEDGACVPATSDTRGDEFEDDAECAELGLGDSCITTSCTVGCVCNASKDCVPYCEYQYDTDTSDASCTDSDSCIALGGSDQGEGERYGCAADEICCSYTSTP